MTQSPSNWPTDKGVFHAGNVSLQSGAILQNAKLSWKTHGTLSAAKDNVIVYPTSYGAQHPDLEWLIGPDGVLDPTQWFIVIPDMFGNGLSSSPSDDPQNYPDLISAYDNVHVQRRFLGHIPVRIVPCVVVVIVSRVARAVPKGQSRAARWRASEEVAVIGRGRVAQAPQENILAVGRGAGWRTSRFAALEGQGERRAGIEEEETLAGLDDGVGIGPAAASAEGIGDKTAARVLEHLCPIRDRANRIVGQDRSQGIAAAVAEVIRQQVVARGHLHRLTDRIIPGGIRLAPAAAAVGEKFGPGSPTAGGRRLKISTVSVRIRPWVPKFQQCS